MKSFANNSSMKKSLKPILIVVQDIVLLLTSWELVIDI